MPSAPCTAAVGSGSVRWKYPRPQTCGVSCDAHLLAPKARPPALRSHAHTCDAAHAAVSHRLRSACGSLHPAPSSSPASQAAHPTQCAGLCGAHTVGPRSLHGGGEAVPGADGTRFLRSDRTGGVSPRGPPAHTQPHNCTWPMPPRHSPPRAAPTGLTPERSLPYPKSCCSDVLREPGKQDETTRAGGDGAARRATH